MMLIHAPKILTCGRLRPVLQAALYLRRTDESWTWDTRCICLDIVYLDMVWLLWCGDWTSAKKAMLTVGGDIKDSLHLETRAAISYPIANCYHLAGLYPRHPFHKFQSPASQSFWSIGGLEGAHDTSISNPSRLVDE